MTPSNRLPGWLAVLVLIIVCCASGLQGGREAHAKGTYVLAYRTPRGVGITPLKDSFRGHPLTEREIRRLWSGQTLIMQGGLVWMVRDPQARRASRRQLRVKEKARRKRDKNNRHKKERALATSATSKPLENVQAAAAF